MAGMQLKADKEDKYEVVKVVVKDGKQTIEEQTTQQFLKDVTAVAKRVDPKDDFVTYTFKNLSQPKTIKEAITAKDGKEYTYYFLVNTSGTVIKNKTNGKDGDDYKFTVKNYVIDKVTLDD